MQMKLMLAIALSHDAKLLILDGATSGLSGCRATARRISCMPTLRMANIRYCFFPPSLPTSNVPLTSVTYPSRWRLYYTGPKASLRCVPRD